MYSTCLHCHQSLGKNEAIEHFPVGRRLAFDSAKGRLWVVCPHCARWNLTPIEERWEAVEDCERSFRRQRLRAQTDNVGLARLPDGTDLIRIGSPLRPEFAAWRYGEVFRRRFRRRLLAVGGVSAAAAGAGLLVAGVPALAATSPILLLPAIHIGAMAIGSLRGITIRSKVVGEDGKTLLVTGTTLEHTYVGTADDGPLRLNLRHTYGRQELVGDRATRALATILSAVNKGGGVSDQVSDAANLIADAGDPRKAIAMVAKQAETRAGDYEERSALSKRGARGRTMEEAMANMIEMQRRVYRGTGLQPNGLELYNPGAIHHLPRPYRLALEMSLHETSEQFALEQDLALLERDWREAEEIAAIADNLL